MTAKGFAGLTPGSIDSAPPAGGGERHTGSDPVSTRRRTRSRRWWVIGAAALAVAGITAAMLLGGHPANTTRDQQFGGVRAAHGPTRIVDNVPTGYSHDSAGAASAAVNVVQALAQAGAGRIAMDKVVSALVVPDPGPELRKSIDISRNRAADADVLNVLPAAVSVLSYTPDQAQVSVWTVGVSRSSISPGDPVSVMTVWTTDTVTMAWREGDWKAREKTGRVGPTPDEVVAPGSGSPLAKPLLGGYFSFYVN